MAPRSECKKKTYLVLIANIIGKLNKLFDRLIYLGQIVKLYYLCKLQASGFRGQKSDVRNQR